MLVEWLRYEKDVISRLSFWPSPVPDVIALIDLLMALLIGLVSVHQCAPCLFPTQCFPSSDCYHAPLLSSSPLLQAVFLLSLPASVCFSQPSRFITRTKSIPGCVVFEFSNTRTVRYLICRSVLLLWSILTVTTFGSVVHFLSGISLLFARIIPELLLAGQLHRLWPEVISTGLP